MDAAGQPKEPLSRIIFARSYPTVHDINMLTRGADHLDIIIGFSTGDILWFDPLSNKYARINKAVSVEFRIDKAFNIWLLTLPSVGSYKRIGGYLHQVAARFRESVYGVVS